MRLLEKSKINESQAIERKMVIDGGITLAKKVDTLRADLLSLEKQRADFIAGSQGAIESTLRNLKSERGIVKADIAEAQKQLRTLREPLDEEWKRLEQEKSSIIALKLDSETYFQTLLKERNEVKKEKEWVDTLKESAERNEKRTLTLLRQVEVEKNETKRVLIEVKQIQDSKEIALYTKEATLDEREKRLVEKEKQLAKERLELNKEKKLLSIKKQRYER